MGELADGMNSHSQEQAEWRQRQDAAAEEGKTRIAEFMDLMRASNLTLLNYYNISKVHNRKGLFRAASTTMTFKHAGVGLILNDWDEYHYRFDGWVEGVGLVKGNKTKTTGTPPGVDPQHVYRDAYGSSMWVATIDKVENDWGYTSWSGPENRKRLIELIARYQASGKAFSN